MSRRRDTEARYLGRVISIAKLGVGDPQPLLDPDLFATTAHKEIMRAIGDVLGAGDRADALAVHVRLQVTGRVAQAEGDYVFELEGKCEPNDKIVNLAKSIRRAHDRDTVDSGLRLAKIAADGGDLEKVREIASGIALAGVAEKPFEIRSARESAGLALSLAHMPQDGSSTRLRLGDEQLEQGIGTLPPGSATVVGADTGVGKSTFTLHLADSMGTRTGIVSIEDGDSVYGSRLLSKVSRVSGTKIFLGTADMFELAHMQKCLARVSDDIRIAYAIGSPLADVLSAIRALVTQHGCRVIVVDYLQAIRFGTKVDRRVAIADAYSQVKALCHRLGVALVMCSQLSRPSGDQSFREPTKHHLKESGDIENGAEAIILLWKKSDKPNSQVYGKVAKLKWGVEGHRFQFARDDVGNLVSCAPWGGDYPEDEPNSYERKPKSWAGKRPS